MKAYTSSSSSSAMSVARGAIASWSTSLVSSEPTPCSSGGRLIRHRQGDQQEPGLHVDPHRFGHYRCRLLPDEGKPRGLSFLPQRCRGGWVSLSRNFVP